MKKLWFAFKFVSLNYWKQQPIVFARLRIVVICFQICIFELLKTTVIGRQCYKHALWFAFKFVSLNYWKQLVNKSPNLFTGCDLLSNLYLWTIENNLVLSWYILHLVVICFQICIFELLKTTTSLWQPRLGLLWFAFKFVSLNYWKQLKVSGSHWWASCDLLSNLYLWTIENNCRFEGEIPESVVICFQICIFELLKTTTLRNILLLGSCDLLSNLYLWTIENN